MNPEFYIFAGHFGSGKTEVALNFAYKKADEGKKVTIIDLDIVNPYFRTADAKSVLEKKGINLIASEFARSNLDMPTVAPEVMSAFYRQDGVVIFDVGGDEDGAFALGQYNRFFQKLKYEMYLVVNTKRPMTQHAEELVDMARVIEEASRLKFTGIINNTNLGAMTDENTLLSDYDEILKLEKASGIPIVMQSGLERALSKLPEEMKDMAFAMDIMINMPWQM